METFKQDLKYSLRLMWKNRGFTLIAVLALALGIGANSAIFSVVNAVLLRPLPYPNPERLMMVWENQPELNIKEEVTSVPNYADWRDQNSVFEGLAAITNWRANITGDGEPERLAGNLVTTNAFTVLGVQPMLGRTFLPEEATNGNNRVVILSYGYWQRRFGGDANIVGRSLTLNGNPFTVVGIMPKNFQYLAKLRKQPIDVWTPLVFDAKALAPERRRADFLSVFGRLKPGISQQQGQAEFSVLAGKLSQQHPESNTGWTIELKPLHEHIVGNTRLALLVLLGAVTFLLLIACANVANLLLAKATVRQKEIAIRMALGAGRRRIVQQLLTESIMLALTGGLFGLLLAIWGAEALLALSAGSIPRSEQFGIDLPVLGFTLLISLITGIVFGLVPALQASKPDLNNWLKEGGTKGGSGGPRHRVRDALVVAEVALSLVLLIGAGLMMRSFLRLQQVDPGFKSDHLLTLELILPKTKYPDNTALVNFYQQLQDRLAAMPQVQAVGEISTLPLSGGGDILTFNIEGRPEPQPGKEIDAQFRIINADYFRALNIPLLKGRFFNAQDSASSTQVAIISNTMAKRFWPDQDPLGQRITLGDPKTDPLMTIVGVVGDVRHEGLDADLYPQMYQVVTQLPRQTMAVAIRTTTDPLTISAAVRAEIKALDNDLPIAFIRPMDELVSDSVAQTRFRTIVLLLFAGVALVLAAVGIYGVISYSVTQRTQEIGIRVALGARPSDVLKMVLGQGMSMALLGVVIGLAAAFALTRLMSSLLFGVSAFDPLTFIGIALLLSLVAFISCLLPARRATKVDPMVALRYE